MLRNLRFKLEYLLVAGFVLLIGLVPARTASDFGAWLGRRLGMRLRRTRLARKQMETHLPNATPDARERYLREMWEHLGRLICEYPHLEKGHLHRWLEIHGREHYEAAKKRGKPIMCISGHIGSWEMVGVMMAELGEPLHLVYRPPNNPYLNRLIHRIRSRFTLGHYGKGTDAAKGTLAALRNGEAIGMLIDQKDNAGAAMRFLEAEAMTMVSAARLARKVDATILPVRVLRVNGTHFRGEIFPPIEVSAHSGNHEKDDIAIMQQLTNMLAEWVRANPGQWFWLHRRWPKA